MGRTLWRYWAAAAVITAYLPVMALPARAQERPTTGLLYDVKETGSLNYDCQLDGDVLICDFVQISVWFKSKPSDLAEAMRKAKEDYSTAQREIDKKQCQQVEALMSALKGEQPPPGSDVKAFEAGMSQMTKLQKSDAEKMFATVLQYCSDPTEANYLAIIRNGMNRDGRTCQIRAHPYKQRFRKLVGSNVWVVAQDGPEGTCGVVNVSRFEMEESLGISFWKYFARKTVTNRSGKEMFGMSCSGLDEKEYEYDWRSQEKQMSCDYLKFGIF